MTTRFISSTARTSIAFAIGAGSLLAAATAHAQVVNSGLVNLLIPNTSNGLYLNVVTGASNLPGLGPGATVSGWDINPWAASGIGFLSPTAPTGGAYVLASASTVGNLVPGNLIGGTSSFGNGLSGNVAQWTLNSANNFFGFRFVKEGAGSGTLHYGWAQIRFGENLAVRTLVQYAYEATPGASIGVVPEPGTYAMMGLGVIAVLVARRRLSKQG